MRWLLYLFVFFIICASAYASDINILTYRDNYRPLETFQAEIILDKEPLNELNNLNFELYKDESVGILLFLEKLSNKRYFVYFDIPDVEKGEYNFKIKNVDTIEDGVLRRISEEKIIEIQSINSGFEYLLNNQNQDGSFSDITETSLGVLALKNIDNEKANLGISYLINNQDPTGCYPSGNCNVKDTSFALLALSKFNENYIKTKNWLKDASNNFELGVWSLRLEGYAVCGDIQLNGIYDLNIENNEINITCDSEVDFTLTHNYLGNSYTIYEYTGNNINYIIDNSGCYGLGYKQECDYINTLYASWALKEINENFPRQYLRDNKLDTRTIDHALGYILYQDNYNKDWLFNNYLNGYWSYNSAHISQEPDYFVSALATYGLRNEFLFEESKEYLTDKTEESILDSSLILYLLFNDEMELPSISINPGIVNKKSIFNLKIKNNKDPINIFIEAPNFTNLPSNIYLEDEVNYNINIDDSFDIIINYDNYSYTIPVLSKDEVIEDEDLPLLPPPKDAIQFVNEDVNISLRIDENPSDELVLVNNWDFKLSDIKLNVTGRLKEILELEQDYFDSIESNGTLSTNIYLNKNKNPSYSYYEGYLLVKSSSGTLDAIKFSINFEVEPFVDEQEELKLSGLECESDEDCEEGEECVEETCIFIEDNGGTSGGEPIKEKKSLWWLWVIIILIIGVLIFIFFRRKKEVTQSFEEYAKKVKK